MRTPILVLHICAGMLAMLSGAVAASFRKGSHRHVVAGKVFVFSMLTMAAGGIYLAILKHEPDNVGGGLITFYLTVTAWLTARRRDGQTSKLDWTAVLIPLTMGSLLWVGGLEKIGSHAPPEDGDPAGLNFFMGSVLLLAAAGDVRMLVRRGVLGTKRISRHLWRMCFAWFIATASFFLGGDNRPLRLLSAVGLRQQGFRTLLRADVLFFLAILPLLLLIYWFIRVRFANAFKTRAPAATSSSSFVRTRSSRFTRSWLPKTESHHPNIGREDRAQSC